MPEIDAETKAQIEEMMSIAEYMLPKTIDLLTKMFKQLVGNGFSRGEALDLLSGQDCLKVNRNG